MEVPVFVSPEGFGNALEGVACDDLKLHAFQTIRGAAQKALDARFAALPMEILGGSLGSKEPHFLDVMSMGIAFRVPSSHRFLRRDYEQLAWGAINCKEQGAGCPGFV